jgi:vitamin B12 transporter
VVFDPAFNSTYENIDEADIQGAETFIRAQPLDSLAIHLDYTYTDAEDNDSGERLLRRPKHKLDLDVEFRPISRASINLAVIYVSDYNDISRESSGIVKGDDYAVLDVAADYQLNRQWRLFGRVENATDEHYEPADGFQASDRALLAGVELKL